MKILCIGDVTSPAGIDHLKNNLWRIRKEYKIDFCIVNGENAALVASITPPLAETLLSSGADVITGGNHTMRQKSILPMLDSSETLLRPINYPSDVPGHGYGIFDVKGYRLLVISAMGNVMIEPTLDNPYPYIDRVLKRENGKYDFAIMDFHAEATGEKIAMGYAYDGIISVIFGTHTHVPTADTQILPKGTGYVSDVGMCGESGGVLGMDPKGVVERMRTRLPVRFTPASGPVIADGVVFTLAENTGRVTEIERIRF